MSKIIYVYAPAVMKCIHIRTTDAWLKKVKMALAIGCTLDGYCVDGSRIKRKNQRNVASKRSDSDNMFKGYDVFLNKNGMWEFKKYIPKTRKYGEGLLDRYINPISNSITGYKPDEIIIDSISELKE